MTSDRLKVLIAGGETLDVEFKSEAKGALTDGELLEAVVCLANRRSNEPAYLCVGVEDGGTVTGAKAMRSGGQKTDCNQLLAVIANRTRPSMVVRIEKIPLDGKDVLVFEVPSMRTPVGTTDGKYVRRGIGGRGKPECLPFHYHEMQAIQADRGMQDYSTLPVPDAVWEDLDPLEFDRFRRAVRESRGFGDRALIDLPDIELAKVLGAVEGDHGIVRVRVLGLLLFGKEEALTRYIPTHEVAFQVLAGVNVELNEFFRAPLFRIMEELQGRFKARNSQKEIVVGMLRIDIPDYPERAFREGLANALLHRDYTRLGTVHVQWHQDRIEISSPGGFPEGVHLENILVTPPRPRSPILADAFKRAGLVERTARGIDTIFLEQLRNGRPAPSYDRSSNTDVILILPGGTANLEFARLVAEESREGRTLHLDDLLLLNTIWQERTINNHRAAVVIQKTEPEARGVLQRLVEIGLIDKRGDGKGRNYHLSARTYQRLDEKAAYTRLRGFEPYQQEQMILQYVQKNGQITRREAADLCKISSAKAKYVLTTMKNKKKLVMKGNRRGVIYQIASNNMDKSK